MLSILGQTILTRTKQWELQTLVMMEAKLLFAMKKQSGGVIEFDSACCKNNVDLNRIIGGSFEQFSQEVERKFSKANEEMKTLYVNPLPLLGPCFLFVAGFMVSIIGFSVYVGRRSQRGESLNDKSVLIFLTSTIIFIVLLMCMIIPIGIRTYQKNEDVKQILRIIFSDWIAKGVEIWYHPVNEFSNGYLKLILRPLLSLQ